MTRKALAVVALLLGGLVSPAAAQQFSRITPIELENGDGSQAASFASTFTLKVGAHCTWGVSGTTATLDCTAAGGGPGGATGTLQYNAGSSTFGGVTDTTANKADCDGFMDPCQVFFTSHSMSFSYVLAGTDADGTMDNAWGISYGDGDWSLFSQTDSSVHATLTLDGADGVTDFEATGAAGVRTGINFHTDSRVIGMSRYYFDNAFTVNAQTTNFAVSAGWGASAVVQAASGGDNLFMVEIDAAGAGTAANPEFTYTYANGDWNGSGASTMTYVCAQSGGDDVIADVTTKTRNQTNEVFIWHGTPTAGKRYEITCSGAMFQ